MAQGRGTNRLLGLPAKVASARAILALAAVAVLVLSGCGGDSDEDSGGTVANTTAPANAEGQASPGSSGSSSSDGTSSSDGGSSPGQSQGSGPQGSQGDKQGPRVAIPEGEPEPGITPQEREQATIVNVLLESPDVQPVQGGVAKLSAAHTCDGENTSPELRWKGIPPEAKELILLAANVKPVEGKLFFDWALAGIDPELEGIEAGKLPKGAIVGRNSFGELDYSVCPPEGQAETIFFSLIALPEPISPQRGFDPMDLRKQALEQAANAGLMAASYQRG